MENQHFRLSKSSIHGPLFQSYVKIPEGYVASGTIWLFNIAMERSTMLLIGKPSISMGHLYHGYVSHNQKVVVLPMQHPLTAENPGPQTANRHSPSVEFYQRQLGIFWRWSWPDPNFVHRYCFRCHKHPAKHLPTELHKSNRLQRGTDGDRSSATESNREKEIRGIIFWPSPIVFQAKSQKQHLQWTFGGWKKGGWRYTLW